MQDPQEGDPKVFDADFYQTVYPDTADADTDPRTHFDRTGWRAGRDPNPWFSTSAYLAAYPDIDNGAINPFDHYVEAGAAEGRVAQPSVHARDWARTRVLRALARLDGLPDAAPRPPRTPAEAAALLAASSAFDAGYYAAASGASGSRTDLALHYLSTPAAGRAAPSAEFDPVFYHETYLAPASDTPAEDATGAAAETDADTAVDSVDDMATAAGGAPSGGDRPARDIDPLLDYILEGKARGHYPNLARARADAELIGSSIGVYPPGYREARGPLRVPDLLLDYVLYGAVDDLPMRHGFDGTFVRQAYMRRLDAVGAPLAWYVRHRGEAWVFAALDEAMAQRDEVAGSPFFDAGTYARIAGIDPAEIDPALHYLLRGVQAGLPCSDRFHGGHYLAVHGDLRKGRLNPLVHYTRHGHAEGRQGIPPQPALPPEEMIAPGGVTPTGRPRIIVVSHEASFTGAPIVALNIARAFAATHDVITWLGKTGPLAADFEEVSARVITGFPAVLTGRAVLDLLAAEAPVDFAIVNSAISGATLPALRLAGIPSVLLVHDFANYVSPRGSLSRMVLHAHLSVFPARIVASAVTDEMSHMGLPTVPDSLRITHQGHNGTGRSDPDGLTPQAIRERLGIADRPEVKILFGGGWVQPRKGVDLFLQAAADLRRGPGGEDWRFVWVGGNYRPDEDMLVSTFLADQVEKSGLADRFAFFEEQPDLDAFWKAADVFFLSSRLDPFPNIALDALMENVPVVCFEGATGIADLAGRFVRAVPFCDPAAAADAIRELGADLPALHAAFDRARPELERDFSFDTYVEKLTAYGAEAAERAARQRALLDILETRPVHELRRLAATVPGWARLTPNGHPEILRQTIAGMALSGGPIAPARIAAGEPLELLPPPPARGRICPTRPGPTHETDWAVHLHAARGIDSALAELLAALPEEVEILLTAPRAPDLPEALAERIRVLPGAFLDAFDGLAGATAATARPWIAHVDLGLPDLGDRAALLDPHFVDRALNGASDDIAAAWPEAPAGTLPRKALDRLGDPQPGADDPVPPYFGALFRRETVARFLEDSRAAFLALAPGLDARARAALRALQFARHAAAAETRMLLCRDADRVTADSMERGLFFPVPPAPRAPDPEPDPEPESKSEPGPGPDDLTAPDTGTLPDGAPPADGPQAAPVPASVPPGTGAGGDGERAEEGSGIGAGAAQADADQNRGLMSALLFWRSR